MRPVLVLNPPSDVGFARIATRVVDAAQNDIEGAQKRLRDHYPAAVIRARDLSGETIVVWYVYREGNWVR